MHQIFKQKIVVFGLVVISCAIFGIIASSTPTYATGSCWDGNGHFGVSSSPTNQPYTRFSQLGGEGASDNGVALACSASDSDTEHQWYDKTPYAILFFTDTGLYDMHDGNYYFRANVRVDMTKTDNRLALFGLVHDGANDSYAKDVHLCLKDSCGPDYSADNDVFTVVANDIYRGGDRIDAYARWTQPDEYKYGNVVINGFALMSKIDSGDAEIYSETNEYYIIKIYNYRCYNEPSLDRSNCGSSQMYLTVNKRRGATFTGNTTVDNTNIKSSDGNYTATFTHSIARTDTSGIQVTNYYHTSISRTGTSEKPGNKVNSSFISSGTRGKTFTDTISGHIAPGQTITICETLTYNNMVSQTGSRTDAATEKKCVTIKRDKYKDDCGYYLDSWSGGNNAQIGVENGTVSGQSQAGTLNGGGTNVTIWARPGDSIKFHYCMSADAKLVNDTYGNGLNTTYKVTATSSTGSSEKYYFGNDISVGKTWQPQYTVKAASPSDDAGSKYTCTEKYGNFKSNFYQIPGLAGGNNNEYSCTSSDKTKPSDVGSTITHTLNWNSTYAQTYSYECGDEDDPETCYYVQNTSNGNGSSSAAVKIPYNYTLKPNLSNNQYGDGVVYGGQTMSATATMPLSPRDNSAFSNQFKNYATISKTTHVKVEFYYSNSWRDQSDQTYDVIVNPKGNLTGSNSVVYKNDTSKTFGTNGEFTFDVSDNPNEVSVGDQACIRMTVWPLDSHNNTNDNNVALSDNGNSKGVYTVCNTYAKKPTMSVESSNAYANGEIDTSTTPKTFSGGTYLFGSWSEYSIFGKVKFSNASGMSSGAALGYDLSNNGTSLNANRSNSGNVAKSPISVCTFSTQTFANADCATGQPSSAAKLNIGTASVDQFKSRIKDRFTSGDVTPITGLDCSGRSSDCFVAQNGTQYANLSNTTEMNKKKDSNGITHLKYDGNAIYTQPVISCENITAGGIVSDDDYFTSMTNVDQISGTLVLNGNIEAGLCNSGGNNDPVMSNLGQITEQVIVADKVYLTNNVTQVDAIIIANEVNTCAYNSLDDLYYGNKVTKSNLNSDMCNRSVVFNAPVITKKLVLARTAGAGHQESSIQRAEIFNLRMDTYFWSYSQMQRYSQAVTTFSRELPVRY